jgi:anhydro-N-acetylmuramic acid kinase
MVYKVISLHCGSLHEGFNIAYAELQNQAGKWEYSEFVKLGYSYPDDYKSKFENVQFMYLADYLNLNNTFGKYLGEKINEFIKQNNLEYRVQIIALKGYGVQNNEMQQTEIGNPGFIAAITGINVIANFSTIDSALGGKGEFLISAANDLLPGTDPEIQLALLAVLRWREENSFSSEKTGATRGSIGGAVWMGQEA